MKLARPGATIALVLAAGTLLAAPADAACQRNDLAGRWKLAGASFFGLGGSVTSCNVSITGRGNLSGTCVERAPGARERTDLSGSLTVNAGCAVRGSAALAGARETVQGQLSPGKDVLIGISFDGGSVSQFTAVRR